MWGWKEKWIGNHICVYIAEPNTFGFGLELTTKMFELFLGYFGIRIEW